MSEQDGKFFKTTITIYTDYNPSIRDIGDLAREAISGDAICCGNVHEEVQVNELPADAANFFNVGDESDDEPTEYIDMEDCIAQGTHLTKVDDDGYCNFCGCQAEA